LNWIGSIEFCDDAIGYFRFFLEDKNKNNIILNYLTEII